MIDFIFDFWWLVLAGLILIGVAFAVAPVITSITFVSIIFLWLAIQFHLIRVNKKIKEEEIRIDRYIQEANQKKYEQSRQTAISTQEKCRRNISDFIENNCILSSFLVIDSNIWMSREYAVFFDILEEHLKNQSKCLTLYGPQFDEICNIKKNTDFGEDKNLLARMAIDRIDKLNEKGLLKIEPITIESERGAYADPLIIRLLAKITQTDTQAILLSDDKELRIRVREHIRQYSSSDSNVTAAGLDTIRVDCQKASEHIDRLIYHLEIPQNN